MYEILILVLALCMDTFVASMAYGANRVTVTWDKIAVMNCICSGCLGLALFAGGFLDRLVPESFTRAVCFVSLSSLGVIKLLDYGIKKTINRYMTLRKDIRLSLLGLTIVIGIYGDPMAADLDHSQSLSWKETVYLSFAMSIDSLIAGTLTAFLKLPVGLTVMAAFFSGAIVMEAGLILGKKLASRWNCDISWVSGLLFLLLALTKSFT